MHQNLMDFSLINYSGGVVWSSSGSSGVNNGQAGAAVPIVTPLIGLAHEINLYQKLDYGRHMEQVTNKFDSDQAVINPAYRVTHGSWPPLLELKN